MTQAQSEAHEARQGIRAVSEQPKRQVALASPLLGDVEYHLLRAPLESGWVTQGPNVQEFERRFAEIHEVDHAVAASSGTTALHLMLLAIGIGPGDEVIVPSFTWVATANAVAYCGATPVFADVDPSTYNMTPESVAAVVTERTKAVMVVHQFGLMVDMEAMRGAVPEGVVLVEDAACAVGARYRGRSAGSLGKVAAFSFHPRKVITTGEGGMVTTNDSALADAMRTLRNHGLGSGPESLPPLQAISEIGFNYRMSDLHGAIGVGQLGRLDEMLADRRRRASWYLEQLADVSWLSLPRIEPEHEPSWQAFVVVADPTGPIDRDGLATHLAAAGVETRPGTHAVADLPAYSAAAGTCPISTRLAERSIAIPLHNRMTADDYKYVVATIKSAG